MLPLKGRRKQNKTENIPLSIVLGSQNQTFALRKCVSMERMWKAAGCPLLLLLVSHLKAQQNPEEQICFLFSAQ